MVGSWANSPLNPRAGGKGGDEEEVEGEEAELLDAGDGMEEENEDVMGDMKKADGEEEIGADDAAPAADDAAPAADDAAPAADDAAPAADDAASAVDAAASG